MNFRGRHSGVDGSSKTDKELSPDSLAKELADVQEAQAELTRTIDRLAGQIASLQTADHPSVAPSPPQVSEPAAERVPAAAADSPPPPPPGFALRAGSPSSVSASPPPPPIGAKPPSSSPPPPPLSADAGTKRSPLDRLLGEDFGKPRVHPSTQSPAVPIKPNFATDSAPPKEPAAPAVPEPKFHVSPLLGEPELAKSPEEPSSANQESSAPKPTQAITKPAPPFSFNATLDQLSADEPGQNGQANLAPSSGPEPAAEASIPDATEHTLGDPSADDDTETPAADFFRSGGQSFASAAAMVNDILAATPDAAGAESGQAEAQEQAGRPSEEPNATEIPITPDFFTAHPKKRFRLRR